MSEPLYRIVYQSGAKGWPRPWWRTLRVIKAAYRSGRGGNIIRVERHRRWGEQ